MVQQTTYRLRLPSRTENLELIRDFVSKIARNAGFSEEEVGKIQLAVDEACTNVVKHAYNGDTRKPIDVAVRIDYDRLTIVVADEGKGFDPKAVEISDLSEYLAELKVGGLGIYLIRTLMDEVEYDIRPGVRNEVRMVKYLLKPDEGERDVGGGEAGSARKKVAGNSRG